MIYLDLFSGIGGFALGLQQAGIKFKKHYFSEIDKFAIANYTYNFKDSIYVGAVENVSRIERPNVVTFGFPCQDLSIAGKQKGITGERSGLFFKAIDIIKKYKPEIFIFENVKGLLSSNEGKDFEAVLRSIANVGLYECEWQLVNTSWILPQNRERVYFVGLLRDRSKPRVFPFREIDKEFIESQRISQERRKWIRMSNTRTLSSRYYKDGGEILIKPVLTPDRKEKRQNGRRFKENGEPAFTLNTQDNHGVIITTNTKKGYEFATNGDSINFSLPRSKTRRGRVGKSKAQSLDTQSNQGVIQDTKIRRLTEIECERLQGFPDNWTKNGVFNGITKEISRTQRYKMLGNAVTVDWPKLIAERLWQDKR